MAPTHSGSNAEPNVLVAKGRVSEEGIILECVSCENQRISQKTITRSRIVSVSFKEAEFQDCSFSHTVFIDCYFRGAKFTKTTFNGCFFERCNFDGARIANCDFEYSEFSLCRIAYSQLEDCFPKWQNVLLRFARSLRKNAESTGDPEEYRKFLSLELRASEIHYRHMFTKFDGYYKKYRVIDRIRAFKRWASMEVDRVLWGYGESWTRVVLCGVIVIFLFALGFRYTGADMRNMPQDAGFWSFLALSASNFMSVGYDNVTAGNAWARFLAITEGAVGLIVFGFLVTSLYLRISKR